MAATKYCALKSLDSKLSLTQNNTGKYSEQLFSIQKIIYVYYKIIYRRIFDNEDEDAEFYESSQIVVLSTAD